MTTDTTTPDAQALDNAMAATAAAHVMARADATSMPTASTPGKAGTAARAAGKGTTTTKAKPATRKAAMTRRSRSGSKPAKKGTTTAKLAGKKGAAKPPDGKRKDEPIKGDMKGKTLENYRAVLKVVPALPADALNANAVAAKLSEKAGKTVWPIPTKRYLETAVDRGDVVKLKDNGKALYHLPAKKGKDGS
jgi:hypothetical protein